MAEIEPRKAIEHETEPTVIGPGVYECVRNQNYFLGLRTPVPSKDNQRMIGFANMLSRIQNTCQTDSNRNCPNSCPVAELKKRIEFYIDQNRSVMRAVED